MVKGEEEWGGEGVPLGVRELERGEKMWLLFYAWMHAIEEKVKSME